MVQQRHVLAIMLFIGLAVTVARTNVSLVLTQMVYVPNANTSANTNNNNSSGHHLICPVKDLTPVDDNGTTNVIDDDDRYHWSQYTQGLILSAFYWGYLFSEIPGGLVAQKFGAKKVLLLGIFLSTVVTCITPMVIKYAGEYGFIVTRVFTGFFFGAVHPALSMFAVAWFPQEQLGRFCSFIYIGIAFGAIISTYSYGQLIHFTHRWDLTFYSSTGLSLIWCILFAYLCYEQPQEHPYIQFEEKEFLKGKIRNLKESKEDKPPTPWRAMLTNRPVIVLILASVMYNWSYNIVNADLSKYMNDILHVSISKNGLYSSLPKVLQIVLSLSSGFVSDWLHENRGVSLTNVRKIFVILGSIFPSVSLMAASYSGCDETLAVVFLTIAVGGHGFNSVGTTLNLYDLGPNYVASLTGVVNSVSTVAGILAPYIIGILTPNALLIEWRLVFWITFALDMIKMIIFTMWGTAKAQSWNTVTPKP